MRGPLAARPPAQVELRHLRAFVEVTRTGNVSRAAEQVGLTQSRVSQQLKELERALDAALFTRVGRRLVLTPAGRLFHDRALEALSKFELAVRALGDTSTGERSHFRIGVVPSCNTMFMPAILGSLHAQYPGYTAAVEEGSADDLERDIEAGRLDVGLAFLRRSSPSLRYRRAISEKFTLVLRRDHRYAARRRVAMSVLNEVELALLPPRYFMRQRIEEVFVHHQVRPRIGFEISSLPAIIRTVHESGLGTLLPRFVIPPTEASNLAIVELEGRQPSLEIGLISPTGGGRNAPVERFMEVAIDVIQRRAR
jgi:LysR family cyn operon transcriptional activator